MFLHYLILFASDTTTVTDALRWISQGGILGVLVFILLGGYKKWWVWGWIYEDAEERATKAEKERDDWRDIALTGTSVAEKTVDLFKRSRDK